MPTYFGDIAIRKVSDIAFSAFISSFYGTFEFVNSMLKTPIPDEPMLLSLRKL